MFTFRKRHLRKKRFFLANQHTFALFNSSNLKTSKIHKAKLSLQNAKLYTAPLFLAPPKIARGYPLILVIYENILDFHTNIPEIVEQINCLGICIKDKWFSPDTINKEKTKDLDKKTFALLLTQFDKLSKITFK